MNQSKLKTESTTTYEINIESIVFSLWKKKWLILFVGASILSILSVVVFRMDDVYRAETVLVPTGQEQGFNLSGLGGQIGSLASIAGVDIGDSQGSNTALARKILESERFLSSFAKKYDLVHQILAVRSWDADSNRVIYDRELYDENSGAWVRNPNKYGSSQPSDIEIAESLRDNLFTSHETSTGFLTIGIEHKSPIIATQILELLVSEINDNLRTRDISEAQRSVDFIVEEMEKSQLASMQQVFSNLLEQQVQKVMLANVRPDYVYQMVDRPLVPETPVKPARLAILVFGGFFGFLFVCLLVLFNNFLRKVNFESK